MGKWFHQWLAPTKKVLRAVRTNFTRAATWTLLGSLALLAITGVPLIWRYDPDHRLWYQDVHLAASSAFIIAAFALAVHWCRARLRLHRKPAHINGKLVAGLLVLMVVAGGTGPALAWIDYLVVTDWRSVETEGNGIVAIWEAGVSRVRTSSTVISRGEYQFDAILHVLVAPLLLAWITISAVRKHPARVAAKAGKDAVETPDEEADADSDAKSESNGEGDGGRKGGKGTKRTKGGDSTDDKPVKPTNRTNAKRERQRENKRQGNRKPEKPAKQKADAGSKK